MTSPLISMAADERFELGSYDYCECTLYLWSLNL